MGTDDEGREAYSIEQIREAFTNHGTRDTLGVPTLYYPDLIRALRGEFD